MDPRPVVYALVLGYIVGSEPISGSLQDWLLTREQIGASRPAAADCSVLGQDFQLRQVLVGNFPTQDR